MVDRLLEVASVEPDSAMTDEYREQLLRLMAHQAYGEMRAAKIYARWVGRAPGVEEQRIVAGIVREEIDHWSTIVGLMAELGVEADEVESLRSLQYHYTLSRIFLPRFTWLDVLMSTFLADRAGYIMIEEYARSSYGPWARASAQILAEEDEHAEFGNAFIEGQIRKFGERRIQRALNRWWRLALNLFGPPVSRNHEIHLRLGLKFRGNEERRQAFIDEMTRRIESLGLAVPKLYRNRCPYL